MVHFFGILSPDFGRRLPADEAPRKAGFFGAPADADGVETLLSRAEQDAEYLSGKYPEPDPVEAASARPHAFVMRYTF